MYEHDPTFAAIEVFVDALVAAGVQQVCIAPGARSTPLALLMSRHPTLRAWSHIDERSAAFFALGMAKALQRPVAVVCTSGTAGANLFPAIIEARYAHVPLIILTADRPPELRDCGAPQTIDQIKLYGDHVKWFAEVGSVEAGVPYFRTLAHRAAAMASATPPGPVHLNFPFREPLVPRQPVDCQRAEDRTGSTSPPVLPVVKHPALAVPFETTIRTLAATLARRPRGLVVCGPWNADSRYAESITRLAGVMRYPILAEPTSQVRCGAHDTSAVIDRYDALLRDDRFAHTMSPDIVLRFGPMPTSKAFLQYTQRHSHGLHIIIDPLDPWNDAALLASELLPCDPVAVCDALCGHLTADELPQAPLRDRTWCTQWREANERAGAAIDRQLDQLTELFEGKVFAELAALLPDDTWLYVGNSMPVRDLDSFWPRGARRVRILCNRGANGIDGFVSSGLGAAAVSDQPVVMVTGDLGFYHDLNGLLAAKRHRLRATIIVINNDGGGIFSFLPQAECGAEFAEYFLTPHGLDFRGAVEMYGCAFTRIASWEQFRAAVETSLHADGTTVIEVPSERTRNVELHRQLWAAAAQALSTR
jgi:2-succinyl-5-enolpyruvyl-6-hydroxy-3-cyclohexene-1-carboxylate synthase